MHAVILDECRECFVNYNVIMASLSIIDYTINQQKKLCTWNNCVVTVRVAIHILHSITFQQLCPQVVWKSVQKNQGASPRVAVPFPGNDKVFTAEWNKVLGNTMPPHVSICHFLL